MSIGSRIKERREELGITQIQLAELLGVSKGAVGNYENDANPPKVSILYKLFSVLRCDANFLFQDALAPSEERLSASERRSLAAFRRLDDHGQRLVELVLAEELHRLEEAAPAPAAPAKPRRIIPLFGASFAAGRGEPDFGNPWEDYQVPADSPADFAVRITGNSMEPFLPDGSVALCRKGLPRDGEVAALLVDGGFLVKQVCEDAFGNLYLFSLNRARKDADDRIAHDSDREVRCFGVVLMDPVALPKE